MNYQRHIDQEKKTIAKMIRIYCHAHHGTSGAMLCDDCKQLETYTQIRTGNCVFGEQKPACQVCPVHCYSKANRNKIKEVMRFAGPRMIYLAPWYSIFHFFNLYRTKKMLRNKKVTEIILEIKNGIDRIK